MSHLKSSVNPLVTRLFPQLYYNSISIVQLLMDRQRRYGLSHTFSLPEADTLWGASYGPAVSDLMLAHIHIMGQTWPRCIRLVCGPTSGSTYRTYKIGQCANQRLGAGTGRLRPPRVWQVTTSTPVREHPDIKSESEMYGSIALLWWCLQKLPLAIVISH